MMTMVMRNMDDVYTMIAKHGDMKYVIQTIDTNAIVLVLYR